VQEAPPVPHCESVVPPWHTPEAQQPEQLPGLHAEASLQVPYMQSWPVAHAWQALPLAPHAVLSLPLLQTLFSQQPTQFLSLQSALHAPPTHLSVPLHTAHAAPAAPHAACCAPDMHASPWQQPLAQDAAVQVQSPAAHA